MRKIAAFACALAVLRCGSPAWGQAVPAADPAPLLLRQRLERLVSQGIPGASLAIIQADGRRLAVTAGWADRELAVPMGPAHRFFSGSIGKTFVAALVLQLAQEGKIDLARRLASYFPGSAWTRRLPNGRLLTVEMLLRHTSGIPEYAEQEAVWRAVKRRPDHVWTPLQRLRYVFDRPPLFPAGSGWSYADTNYIILGMLVEKVTGRTYESEVASRLLAPLGLKDTATVNSRWLDRLVSGYSGRGKPFDFPPKVAENGRYAFNIQMEWTGGGLVTSPADLAEWARQLYGGRVLSQGMTARMLTATGLPTDLADGASYGLGAIIWNTPWGAAYGHSGFVPGFNSVMAHFPDRRVSLALQVNTDVSAQKLGRSLFSVLLDIMADLGGESGEGAAAVR